LGQGTVAEVVARVIAEASEQAGIGLGPQYDTAHGYVDGLYSAAAAFFANYLGDDPAITPLTLLDYHTAPLSTATIDAVFARLAELESTIKVFWKMPSVAYVPEVLVQQIHSRGHWAEEIPTAVLADPEGLALSVAGHINAGLVKIAQPAASSCCD
jgi:hypothetical protein